MKVPSFGPGGRAVMSATLLFGFGAVAGAAADRLWVTSGATELAAAPLTVESMAGALDLGTSERARVAALLDSLEPIVARAVVAGPDSLQAAARMARQRLEEVLPPDRRPRFRRWMSDHHDRMMDDMRGGNMMRWMPTMEPDVMRRWRDSDQWEQMMGDRWRKEDSEMMRDRRDRGHERQRRDSMMRWRR